MQDSSHVFLDFNSWICKIILRSRVMARLTLNAVADSSDSCVATYLELFYLVVSCTRTLAIGSCKSEKRAANYFSSH